MKNNKLTYAALFVVTLLIGFVIGFLVQGAITSTRIKKMQSTFTERGMNREFIRAIRPTPEQMKQLHPVLRKYAGKKRDLMQEYRNNQHELFLEFRQETDPYLTPAQKDRLDQMDIRWRQRFMHGPGRGPGPRGKRNRGWN
ncbi:MAG: hypothetical protein GXO86_05580 [Chlorobi bacterium]|nr:hypothetical protein [Chlorobiota bacterium]